MECWLLTVNKNQNLEFIYFSNICYKDWSKKHKWFYLSIFKWFNFAVDECFSLICFFISLILTSLSQQEELWHSKTFLDAFPSFPFVWIILHINHIQNFVSACSHMNLNWIHTICIKITILTSICILVSVCIRVVVWMDFEISNSIKNFVKNFTQSQPVRANLRSV